MLSSSFSAFVPRRSASFNGGFMSIVKIRRRLKSARHPSKPHFKLSVTLELLQKLTWSAWLPKRRTQNVPCRK